MAKSSRHCRPLVGVRGAVSSGHPLATSAALAVLDAGGNALDAAIAAQAVICVTMPQAAGLGGDMLALIHRDGSTTAVNATGLTPARAPESWATDGGSAVTVPGIVDGWITAHAEHGRLPLARVIEAATRIARDGFFVDEDLHRAVQAQRTRISQYGADRWALLARDTGELWTQPELARLLDDISQRGRDAFYSGAAAEAMARAASAHGGTLSADDLTAHETQLAEPVTTRWGAGTLHVQPPSTQGVLLAVAARWLDAASGVTDDNLQHVLVEATEASFAHRSSAAARGAELLEEVLDVDLERAQNRGGPRAYLHTAGVAVSDSDGMVVSSLISVFDDFGSGVFVPELGLTLNNRAAGFTTGDNEAAPAKRPVHTLAPALLVRENGDSLALATPGADGQVQTLLQVLARLRFHDGSLKDALAAPRWRSQNGDLLVESDHPQLDDLTARGHRTVPYTPGDDLFGAVVAAGLEQGRPFAASDWRRNVTTGAA